MDAAGARRVGAGLLGEVEEGSLEELLESLSGIVTNNPSRRRNPEIPMADLSALVARYQRATQSASPPLLSVSGRYLPFLYHLISTLVSRPHNYTVVVVDTEHKFDVTRLVGGAAAAQPSCYPATPADLAHVHVYLPGRGREGVRAALAGVDEFMLHGAHASRGRAWWGTVVIGGTGGHVNAGWKGWLRVDRAEVGGFAVGLSAEEALAERETRQRVVDAAGWVASSPWGCYAFAQNEGRR
ncbi:hypothetical protein F5Y14DRAFT_252751 [Nemania sp. NC0429]|nr:hypothetical protein F5Y14DRAFT_252751 [Nemania sp. NC0429]